MPDIQIPIETSARHVHLSDHIADILFGKGYQLTPERYLSQLGAYLCRERLRIVGPRDILHDVAILGPNREHTQVEISITDAKKLGLIPPIRESGDHSGSASCRLVGPAGEYELDDGVIIARRHLHCSPTDAEHLGVQDGDIVSIEVRDSLRPIVFRDVLVRVDEKFNLSLHLDTDEANSAGLTADSYGALLKN